jgi:hypothetical protein
MVDITFNVRNELEYSCRRLTVLLQVSEKIAAMKTQQERADERMIEIRWLE